MPLASDTDTVSSTAGHTQAPRSQPEPERGDRRGRDVEVVVVGAGFSGIGAAIRLRQAGFRNVLVLEKAAQLGGVWRENTYPGCACDVPSSLYSYSFAPNPGWSRVFAGQREIHDYLRSTAKRHGVDEVLRCGVHVLRARWDAPAARWQLETSDGSYSATALILATGPWHRPRRPELPGLEDFAGPVFHTAQWDHSANLAGARVAVVGSGASAIQLVPEIQAHAGAVHLFQRTAPWLLPKPDVPLPRAMSWSMRRIPGTQRAMRTAQYWLQEGLGYALRHPQLLPPVQAAARAHLRIAVRDPQLRRALTPDYRLGCKRLLTSSTYYPALAQPHVHLHPTAVTAAGKDHVIGADGTIVQADALIMATGFHIGELPLARDTYGADGRSLHERWGEEPEAYLGTSVAGFPNLFLLLGPNLLTGSTSTITVLEAQLDYLSNALTHLRRGGHASLDVTPAIQAQYNAAVQKALRTTVYNTGGCTSYYLSPTGRNTFCWPWSTRRLTNLLSHFDPAAYTWTTQAGQTTRQSAVTNTPH